MTLEKLKKGLVILDWKLCLVYTASTMKSLLEIWDMNFSDKTAVFNAYWQLKSCSKVTDMVVVIITWASEFRGNPGVADDLKHDNHRTLIDLKT
jgi:hypothetical protein